MGQQITCVSMIDVLLVSNDVSLTNRKQKTSSLLVLVCSKICCAHSWTAVAVRGRVSKGLSCGNEIFIRIVFAYIRSSEARIFCRGSSPTGGCMCLLSLREIAREGNKIAR